MERVDGNGPMTQDPTGDIFSKFFIHVPGLDAAGEPWTWAAYGSAILVSAVGLTMWPHLFMKAFAAKSDQVIRRTVILFPTFQVFLVPVFLIGFAGVMFASAPADADFILPFMILETDLPAVVVGLFCAGALSASMSTGDALLHAAASVTVEDGLGPFVKLSEERQRVLMRVLVLAVVVVGVMADALGMRAAFLIAAGVGVLGAPFVFRLPVAPSSGTES